MSTLVELSAQLVSSHAANNKLTIDELLTELQKVHNALKNLESGQAVTSEEAKPALSVKDAFKKNEVICMVCGKAGMRTLARHLKTAHDISPREYKRQFNIPSKQSLAAKSYSDARRKSAQERGLGDILTKAREARMSKVEAVAEATAEAV